MTRWLEADLSKARILALYLNLIEWGDGVYGCEAAARHWYGKPASDLSPTEAAGLAAMIPNPRRLNPRVSAARHERATRRVLWLMGQAGYIGRDVAGLGAEPPPEPVAEDEEPPAAPETEATAGVDPAPRPGGLAGGDPGARPRRGRGHAAAPPLSHRRGSGMYHLRMKLSALLVSDYMTPNPIVVEPEDSLMRALEIIRLRGVRRLPVTVGGMLVGLVTEGDLKRAEPSTLTDSEADFNRVMEETPLSRIMIQNPVTTTADAPLLEAADVLLNTKYGALPVVTGGRVVGILTDNDLIRALVDVLREAKGAQG